MTLQELVIVQLRRRGPLTSDELDQHVEAEWFQIRGALQRLGKQGLVEHRRITGGRGLGVWAVTA